MISEIRKKVIENGHTKIVTYDSEVEVYPYQDLKDAYQRLIDLGFTAKDLGYSAIDLAMQQEVC